MNQNSSNNALGKLNAKNILFSLLYVAACVFIPFILYVNMEDWLVNAISLAVAIISAVAFAKASGGFKYSFAYVVMLIATVLLGGGTFILTGIFASLSCTICLFAYLCFNSSIYVTVALPAIAYIPTLAIVRDPVAATVIFFSLPAAMLTVYAIKKKKPKVSAICHICIGFCISLIVMLAIAIFNFAGSISPESIAAFFESAKLEVTEAIKEVFALIGDSAAEMLDVSSIGLDLDLLAENIVTVSFNLLPAIAVVIFNVLAYLMHSLSLTLIYNDDEKKKEALPMLVFDMSIHSAFLFLLALILSFALASEKTAMYGAVAENLMVILLPGYVITALAALRAFVTKRSPSCLGTLLYFFVIFMIASLSYPVIITTAVVGAIVKIFFFFRKNKKNPA